jgi:hypothetical protein
MAEEKQYLVGWTIRTPNNVGASGTHYVAQGIMDEVEELLEYLDGMEERGFEVTCVDVRPVTPPKREDGKHHHRVNGELQDHTWEDCPQNYENMRKNYEKYGYHSSDMSIEDLEFLYLKGDRRYNRETKQLETVFWDRRLQQWMPKELHTTGGKKRDANQ